MLIPNIASKIRKKNEENGQILEKPVKKQVLTP
jgi:hypothetical protein